MITQWWRDVLFLHWAVEPTALRPFVPAELELDLLDGKAWLAVVPFRMTDIRVRGFPMPPLLELNVRTYVKEGGVFFLSLDAASALAVAFARMRYGLPYYRARMSLAHEGERVRYACRRTHRGARAAEFRGVYGPAGPVVPAEPGSLEHFLVERYCLYVVRNGHIYRGDVAHEPWPLQPAEAEIEVNTMPPLAVTGEPLEHFARGVHARIAPLRPC